MSPPEQDSSGTWAVHRQDDNGNRFIVETGIAREEADRLADKLQSRGHKQLYWVEEERVTTEHPDHRLPNA
jgi:hypothetical protein